MINLASIREVCSNPLGLQGFAIDDLALSRFVTQLRATGVFDAVELQTSSNVQLADGSARQYVVECRF